MDKRAPHYLDISAAAAALGFVFHLHLTPDCYEWLTGEAPSAERGVDVGGIIPLISLLQSLVAAKAFQSSTKTVPLSLDSENGDGRRADLRIELGIVDRAPYAPLFKVSLAGTE